ncbi:beta-ketoacyl synthase N-terminal-like domain-containing protein [Agriterribacter sp.]|uniref:beta-ketoacyl synthase N-terminal-like domain-containing protein n=1 Tax=Agriterribacter sp. TaxID=2821509 RepID=UPI002C608730|nr:beta-ketoacyl synthase N-terminal-like domain-containing protein [Agriterribacter sp.]HRO44232.1 beta-ketoacyl synthase N-terminal-like domain-containing protein [Agriterribacter sp.]HRQ18853.1 beta-ketoacyl synthase N-terminal-like domain-containing protein [Agriterribacter sp.]
MYIQATAGISPQLSFERLLSEPAVYTGNRLSCIEPDYTQLIDPKMIRRMSRIIKMGVAAAMDCLKASSTEMPGAVITGTAYGCLADTETFLTKMVENGEELLTPTAFIQSTHNTVGAQIALLLKCHNYNNTFVHRGFSFESALLDAITLLKEQQVTTALAGGIDELTATSYALLSRFGLYKKHIADNTSLYNGKSKGTIAGEGAAFFLLAAQPSGNDYAQLNGVSTFYKPGSIAEIEKNIHGFLSAHAVRMEDIDLVITGHNGHIQDDAVYEQLASTVFEGKPAARFKHLCGEYPTATAFALWLAANMVKTGLVPSCFFINPVTIRPRRVLIYNHYQNTHHALYLLSAC